MSTVEAGIYIYAYMQGCSGTCNKVDCV